jgi:CDP-paratose 2-epimerase
MTGICGFVGSELARALLAERPGLAITGLDNLSREGAHHNLAPLRALGVNIIHGDLRVAADLDALPACDAVIDCAAQPSVLAGTAGSGCTPAQLVGHNLGGTLHLLEYCRSHSAAFILLSTSRAYSIPPLAALPVVVRRGAFTLDPAATLPPGVSASGIAETFSTAAPVSLYGATKLASEQMALEYGHAFGLPVWINRCGVLAGAGQFGRADQGIFSFWIREWAARRPLRHIGFDGVGHQVRDCLHPADLAPLLLAQLGSAALDSRPSSLDSPAVPRILNVSGGATQAMSLRQLGAWCTERLGPHLVATDPEPRTYDLPWIVLDSSRAAEVWNWRPRTPLASILEEIATHSLAHPAWPAV